MRMSDWSSDVCSSDLEADVVEDGQLARGQRYAFAQAGGFEGRAGGLVGGGVWHGNPDRGRQGGCIVRLHIVPRAGVGSSANLAALLPPAGEGLPRSEEHTSELQSLMRISYAVFCLKKKKKNKTKPQQ